MNFKPKKGQYLEILLRSPRTIFTVKDVSLLWGEEATNAVHVRLNSYVKTGKLIRLCRGIYAKDKKYDEFELATRIYTPSYISFETVLTREGLNFQYYGNIFLASYLNREIEVDGNRISFVRMKATILTNTAGIEHANGIARATKERAFLDRLYVSKDYYFDNLDVLDWEKVFEFLPVYQSKRLERKVKEQEKTYQDSL